MEFVSRSFIVLNILAIRMVVSQENFLEKIYYG